MKLDKLIRGRAQSSERLKKIERLKLELKNGAPTVKPGICCVYGNGQIGNGVNLSFYDTQAIFRCVLNGIEEEERGVLLRYDQKIAAAEMAAEEIL